MADYFLEVKGKKIHCLSNDLSGQPKVLLFHGARFNANTWNQVSTLKSLKEIGVPAVAVDFPGYGLSERGSWNDLSEFIKDLLQAMDLERPVLLGPSMGGNAVLKYAIKYDQVSGLILVGPVGVEEVQDELDRLDGIPVLLIWGENDNVSPIEKSKVLISRISTARLEIVGKQHACYLDDPKKFNDLVEKFITDVRWSRN